MCPYCGQNSYSNTSKSKGYYTDWKSVRAHTPSCLKNTGEYFIDIAEGPIHYSEFINKNRKQVLKDYPNLKSSLLDINRSFKSRNIPTDSFLATFTKQDILNLIKQFKKTHGRIPSYREIDSSSDFPSMWLVSKYFGSLNKAIEAAGFEPNIQNGFGIDTYGLDGHLYRSRAEAYFADNFLYGKYKYVIEPKYPEPHNKFYDWYIEELDLYIELDGGLRPQVIQEKIEINKSLNRNLAIIPTSNLNNACYMLKNIL